MKYLIFGGASTLAQELIKKINEAGNEVCGILHHNSNVGERALYIEGCNIEDESSVCQTIEEVKECFGLPNHVIICSGVSQYHDFIKDDLNQWYNVFNTNYYGAVNVIYHCSRLMCTQPGDHSIIVVGSGYGERHIPYLSSYCAAKGALTSLVSTLSTELSLKGIRINIVTPGLFPSQMTVQFIRNRNYIKQLLNHIPDGRLGSPEEIASIILFLTSAEAKHINGANIVVDGGMLNLIEGGIRR